MHMLYWYIAILYLYIVIIIFVMYIVRLMLSIIIIIIIIGMYNVGPGAPAAGAPRRPGRAPGGREAGHGCHFLPFRPIL